MTGAIAGYGRFYDLGGVAEEPVYSDLTVNLPGGEFLGDGVFAPAYWGGGDNPVGAPFAPGNNPNGLLEAVGPAGYSRPYSGIRALGDAPALNIYLRLEPGGVWGVPTGGGQTVYMDLSVFRNGSLYYFERFVSPPSDAGWALVWFPTLLFTTTLAVAAGDLFTAGITPERMPLIYAYTSGSGGGLGFHMWGELTPPGVSPGQPPMRLHGAVGL